MANLANTRFNNPIERADSNFDDEVATFDAEAGGGEASTSVAIKELHIQREPSGSSSLSFDTDADASSPSSAKARAPGGNRLRRFTSLSSAKAGKGPSRESSIDDSSLLASSWDAEPAAGQVVAPPPSSWVLSPDDPQDNSEDQAEAEEEADQKLLVLDDGFATVTLGPGNSLGCVAPDNPTRVAIFRWIHHPYTTNAVLALIFINIGMTWAQIPGERITRAADGKGHIPSGLYEVATSIDLVLTFLFTLEALLKIFALGFVGGENSYLRSSMWNRGDFGLVVLTWGAVLAWWDLHAPRPTLLRLIRGLRPIQQMKMYENLVNLAHFRHYLADLTIFLLFAMVVFGTIGVQLYAGVLTYQCAEDDGYDSSPAIDGSAAQNASVAPVVVETFVCPPQMGCLEGSMCTKRPEVYYSRRWGFDNIFQAIMLQLVLLSFDNWTTMVQILGETNSSNSELAWLYFVAMAVVLGWLVVNMFVSVICFSMQNVDDQVERKKEGEILVEKLKPLFERIDTDRSGRLETIELEAVAEAINISVTKFEVEAAMTEMDADRSGSVDFEEFCEWWLTDSPVAVAFKQALNYEEAQIRKVFAELDVDGNGELNQEELRKAVDAHHTNTELPSISAEELGIMFSEMHAVGHEHDKVITFHEFMDWWLRGSEMAQRLSSEIKANDWHTASVYDVLNSRGNGNITLDDVMLFTKTYCDVTVGRPQALEILRELQPVVSGDFYAITFETFAVWWTNASGTNKWASKLRLADTKQTERVQDLFELADVDHDGVLTAKELITLCAKLHIDLSTEQADNIFLDMQQSAAGDDPEGANFHQFSSWLYTDNDTARRFQRALPTLEELTAGQHSFFVPGLSPLCQRVVLSSSFEKAVLLAVLANTSVMAVEHHGQSESFEHFLVIAEVVFAIIYMLEAAIKLLAIGPRAYFAKWLNCLDFFCMCSTIMGIFTIKASGLAAFRITRIVFKLLRVARMLKVFTKNDSILMLIKTIAGGPTVVATLTLFMVLVLLLTSLAGAIILGQCHLDPTNEYYYDSPEFPRDNYFTFGSAVASNFKIMTGENWSIIMFYYMGCAGGVKASVYFLCVFILTNIFFVNMFIAVILINFSLDEGQKLVRQQKALIEKKASVANKTASPTPTEPKIQGAGRSSPVVQGDPETPNNAMRRMTSQVLFDEEQDVQQPTAEAMDPLHPQQPNALHQLVHHPAFEHCVLVLIVLSCVATAAEGPPDAAYLQGRDTIVLCLHVFHLTCLVVFTIELLLRVYVDGFRTYVGNGWNVLDLVVVVCSNLDAALHYFGLGIGPVMVLRALRPLRFLRRSQGMRNIVMTLTSCPATVLSVLMLLSLLMVMFALAGMGLFMGRFYRCEENPTLSKVACLQAGGTWDNPSYSFDNFPRSMRAVFYITTVEDWVRILHSAQDTTAVDQAPVENNEYYNGFFVYAYIVVAVFFGTNLFIGCMCSFYAEAAGSAVLTDAQFEWVLALSAAKNSSAKEKNFTDYGIEAGTPRYWLYRIVVENPWFERASAALIGLNMLMIACEHWPQPEDLTTVTFWGNLGFLLYFTVEMTMKLFCFGARGFWDDGFNKLDVLVVGSSWLVQALEWVGGGFNNPSVQSLRSLRILRAFIVMRTSKKIRELCLTVVQSFVPAIYLTLVILLLTFIYAIVGMRYFGGLPLDQLSKINDYNNFDNIFNACKMLLQMVISQDFGILIRGQRGLACLSCTVYIMLCTDPQRGRHPGSEGCTAHLLLPWLCHRLSRNAWRQSWRTTVGPTQRSPSSRRSSSSASGCCSTSSSRCCSPASRQTLCSTG
jgi:Ca2+-binding EF-hand superfamily protein